MNGGTEGRLLLGAFGVSMDPLPVASCVGEGVHSLHTPRLNMSTIEISEDDVILLPLA